MVWTAKQRAYDNAYKQRTRDALRKGKLMNLQSMPPTKLLQLKTDATAATDVEVLAAVDLEIRRRILAPLPARK
jgi:hypothetical protein